ncbi:CHAD domain-containing protein [Ruegeria sp.]|uniref:CHAD domain-containing protein n=1 Tax=Ruegeria sp. TaxID=1879320 RepID=UPI003B5A26D0
MADQSEVFIVPGAFDPQGISARLRGLTIRVEASRRPQPFEILDCYDQSLRSEGRLLLQTDDTLRLLSPEGEVAQQEGTGNGKLVADLAAGPVRAALRGFPKLRALIGIAEGTVEAATFVILDDVQKTRVRGSVEFLSTNKGQASVLHVHPMRGYKPAFQTVCATLRTMAEDVDGIEPVYRILFPGLQCYNAKPEVRLGKYEPSIEVAADIIRTYLEVARQNEAGVIADIDTEFLHDYRVSLRRVRSVLSLFKGVLSPEQTADLKRQFSDLMEPTGRLRDLDVYLLEKDNFVSQIPSSLHAGAEVMFDLFAQERRQALDGLTRRLRSASYKAQMSGLAAPFADTSGLEPGLKASHGAYEYACSLIWKRYRKLCKLARGITPETPDDIVHDLRIDCKKLRYLMEFFAPLFDPKAFKTLIKPLKKLQDNLGLFNDCSVQQEALLQFLSVHSNRQGRANAQLAMAVGGLIAVLDQRQKAERDRVITNFQHFDSPDVQHLFRFLFHHKKE